MNLSQFYSKHKTTILIILVVLSIKVFLFLWAGVNYDFHNNPNENLFSIWHHWDGTVYTRIATYGYHFTPQMTFDDWAFDAHFMPLYPAVTALVSYLTRLPIPPAGMLVSVFFIILASLMFYKLILLDSHNKKLAWTAVILLNIYPVSYFALGIYAESLFIFLTIGSFYCLRTERYIWAGLAAMAAVLTRLVGVVFIPVYGLYALYYFYKNKRFNAKVLALPIIASFGVIVHMIINQIFYGDFSYFFTEKVSYNAGKHLTLPFQETLTNLLLIFRHFQTFLTLAI